MTPFHEPAHPRFETGQLKEGSFAGEVPKVKQGHVKGCLTVLGVGRIDVPCREQELRTRLEIVAAHHGDTESTEIHGD